MPSSGIGERRPSLLIVTFDLPSCMIKAYYTEYVTQLPRWYPRQHALEQTPIYDLHRVLPNQFSVFKV